MDSLLLFVYTYLILFILFIIFFYIIGLKRKTILSSIEVDYLKKRFGFKDKDFNPKKIGFLICLIDPLIVSVTAIIATLPKWNYIFEVILGFFVLLLLIFSFYEIIGRIKKRVMKK